MSDGWTESVHRSRKDTRTWCKGKVGTPHELVIEVDLRQGGWRGGGGSCFWSSSYWTADGGRGHQWSWHCRHVERCTACQKIMRLFLAKEECPDLHPEPSGDPECRNCHLPLSAHDERGYGKGGTAFGRGRNAGLHNFWFSERDRG